MTTWAWKCRACEYEFINPIWKFIEICPKCQVKYDKLAVAYIGKSIGEVVIYKLTTESFDNEKTNSQVEFAIAVKGWEIACYESEYKIYLSEKFSKQIFDRKIAITMYDEKH